MQQWRGDVQDLKQVGWEIANAPFDLSRHSCERFAIPKLGVIGSMARGAHMVILDHPRRVGVVPTSGSNWKHGLRRG